MGTFFSSLDVSWGTLDHSPAGSVQKYPKSAENETNNDRMGRDVFKTGEYIKGVCQVYSDGKCVQKWKLW